MRCDMCSGKECEKGNPCVTKDSIPLYSDPQEYKMMQAAASVEADFYGDFNRIQEIVDFIESNEICNIELYIQTNCIGVDQYISKYLKKLEELKFIKVFNTTPLVLQVLEVPQAPVFNDIKGLLLYVHMNPQQFNFHRNLNRKTAFFETFKEYNSQILVEKIKNAEVPEDHPSNPTTEEIEDIFGFKK